MVVSPHHDDETIGCGGSLYLHALAGDSVSVVFVFAGWSAVPNISDRKKAAEVVQREARNACRVLGVQRVIDLRIEDRTEQLRDAISRKLVVCFREGLPDVVYVPHSGDGDREHSFISEAAREAVWMAESDYFPELGQTRPAIKTILGYEVWKPIQRVQYQCDISLVIKIKESALRKYRSQLRFKNWLVGAVGLNAYRGAIGNCSYAEAFQVIKISNIQ